MVPTVQLHGTLEQLKKEMTETGGQKKQVMKALLDIAGSQEGMGPKSMVHLAVSGGIDDGGKTAYLNASIRITPE